MKLVSHAKRIALQQSLVPPQLYRTAYSPVLSEDFHFFLICPRSILQSCVAKFGGIKVADPVTKSL